MILALKGLLIMSTLLFQMSLECQVRGAPTPDVSLYRLEGGVETLLTSSDYYTVWQNVTVYPWGESNVEADVDVDQPARDLMHSAYKCVTSNIMGKANHTYAASFYDYKNYIDGTISYTEWRNHER